MKKNQTSVFEIIKYLKKKGFTISKKNKIKKEEIGFGSLSRTFLSSLIIISIFFITPLAINLTKETMKFSQNYENNSKNNLKKLIENQDSKLNDDLDQKILFNDVLIFDKKPTTLGRLLII